MVNFRSKYFSERILDESGSTPSTNITKAMEDVQEKCKVQGCIICEDNPNECKVCPRGYKLNGTKQCEEEDEGKKCNIGEYKYDGIKCVKNSDFDSHCSKGKKFTDSGNGPVCEVGGCDEGYGLSMPYFGGICVECPEGCKKCSSSYECTEWKKDEKAIKNKVKGCIEVINEKCSKCTTGLEPKDDKCVVKKNQNSEDIKNLEDDEKKSITNALIEEKIEKDSDFNKKIMKMYKYLKETKLNIIGDYAFKHYYTFGPIRFRPSFDVDYEIVKTKLRRGLDDSIKLHCSPEDSSDESEDEGVIRNICKSKDPVKPEDVFCAGCDIQAVKTDNGLIISDDDLKKDSDLNYTISEDEIKDLKNEMKNKQFNLTEIKKTKQGNYKLSFDSPEKVKKGTVLIIFCTFMKKSRRNRILQDDQIQFDSGSFTTSNEAKGNIEAYYDNPEKIDLTNEKIDDEYEIFLEISSSSMTKEKILDGLRGKNEGSNINVNKSSSGLSGGAIAAIVIVCCVVIIAIIAIAIAIKTKAIGGVKPAYETANNFSTTSGKTVQPEQVYI